MDKWKDIELEKMKVSLNLIHMIDIWELFERIA